MQICRFDKEKAGWAHSNTILSHGVFPKEFKTPFEHAWGYCTKGMELEPIRIRARKYTKYSPVKA